MYRTAATLLLGLVLPATLHAQLLDAPTTDTPLEFGEPVTVEFRVGAEISATRGACQSIHAMVAVPYTGPEQEVRVVSEDFSSHVAKVEFRDLPGGEARVMDISIPNLPRGEVARAVVTYEVRTRPILPPEEAATAKLRIPEKPDREVKQHLSASPYIEVREKQIRSLARDLWRQAEEELEEPTDWQKIEFMYDHVLEVIDYVEGDDKSAMTTLRDAKADCHGRSALFVALCRANKVPARIVWVDGHAYAEFYLEDEDQKGGWYPAESAGTRAFGEMPLARTIMQKGDDFRDPWRRGEKLRYATDIAKGIGNPKVKFIREQVDK